MRVLESARISEVIEQLCLEVNYTIGKDVYSLVKKKLSVENNKAARTILKLMIENFDLAQKKSLPICQDSGIIVVFAEIGQNLLISGQTLENAINKGVEKGYQNLRQSVCLCNFGEEKAKSTPAIVHITSNCGDSLKITLMAKGAGAENCSSLKFFNPTASIEEIEDFVVETVKNAGGKACPPVIVGVGIGGNFETSALFAKKALCKKIPFENKNPVLQKMQDSLLKKINLLGIGPQGLGGRTTALSVVVLDSPRHIASLPVAVNLNCYLTRHKTVIL